MREASWDDCIENNSAVKVSSDISRTKSLIETSDERINLIKDFDEKNCNFVFEDYYTSIMELLQALVTAKGYKISNYMCLGYYLRDVIKRKDMFIIFDDMRYKRNSLTYYGKRMDFETAKQAIEKCKKLIEDIEILIMEIKK